MTIDILKRKDCFDIDPIPTLKELNSLPFAEKEVPVAFILRKYLSEEFADFLTHQIAATDFIYQKYTEEDS